MSYRLINENDPTIQVCLTSETWHKVLNLAEDFGWNPIGEILPGQWEALNIDLSFLKLPFNDHAPADNSSRVVWEDALNLADALEKAFMAYEPAWKPASYFVFEPRETETTGHHHLDEPQPSNDERKNRNIRHNGGTEPLPSLQQSLRAKQSPDIELTPDIVQNQGDYPGLGAMRLVIELCQSGPFRVERFHRGRSPYHQ